MELTIALYHAILALWIFLIGTVIGSFLNVCIYRIPWQKSVIWPASHCPICRQAIASRDNIPLLSWLLLGGRCRQCGTPIPARYFLVELLVGLIFVGFFVTDVALAPGGGFSSIEPYYRLAYHLLLASLLIAATFIDYDLQIIPDEITVTGTLMALLGGFLIPRIRPEPAFAVTGWGGLLVGMTGWLVGAGLTQAFRLTFSVLLRKEAMGIGDVTLMGMIGAFLGWQGAVLAFFIAPFFGILHAIGKLARYIGKMIQGGRVSSADREMPFGPYLSMSALGLAASWPWLWSAWGRNFFATFRQLVQLLVTGQL